MQQIASQNAPSPRVVIPHFIFGGLIWLVVAALIVIYPESFTQHYFNPKLLAITHLIVLGWISMIIFGALYQLIPVIMETKLFSEKLAVLSFFLLALGSILLALSFWNFWLRLPMHIAACILFVSVVLFTINVFVTSIKSSKKNIEKLFIQTSIAWFLFTVIAGILLVINLTHNFMSTPHLELLKLHAHAGIVGWFIQLIIGVGSRLLPMFMVSHNLNTKKLWAAYCFINAGLTAAVICLFIQLNPGLIVSSIFVVSGIIFFLSFIQEAYKKRVKKKLDTGMKQSIMAFIVIIIPLIIILTFFFGAQLFQDNPIPMAIAYGSTLLIGFISSLIMGQTYKTLPFIVWLHVYKGKVGKGKIPFPRDLYSEKGAVFQLWAFAIGFGIFLAGIIMQHEIIIQVGAMILFSSILVYIWNMIKIVHHKPQNHG